MNVKRYLLSVLAVFVSIIVLDFIIHSVILMGAYVAVKDLWRPDMMSYMWIMYVKELVLSFLFVYVFAKGYEGKGILEGVRYGLIIGVMVDGLGSFAQYMIYPLPINLVIQWSVYGIIQYTIVGIVAALIYRPGEI